MLIYNLLHAQVSLSRAERLAQRPKAARHVLSDPDEAGGRRESKRTEIIHWPVE